MDKRSDREEMAILKMRIRMQSLMEQGQKDLQFAPKFSKPIDPDLKAVVSVLQQDCDELENRCEDLEEQLKFERFAAAIAVMATALICTVLAAIFL